MTKEEMLEAIKKEVTYPDCYPSSFLFILNELHQLGWWPGASDFTKLHTEAMQDRINWRFDYIYLILCIEDYEFPEGAI